MLLFSCINVYTLPCMEHASLDDDIGIAYDTEQQHMNVLAQQCGDFTETKLQRYPTACASHKRLLYSALHVALVKAAGLILRL